MRRAALATSLIAAGLSAGEAAAFLDDRIDIIVEEKILYDSNVFRIPDGRPPPLISGGRREDLSATTSLGLNFDVPYSRQRFQGSLMYNDTRYRHIDALDFEGHDVRGLWLWRLGRDWSGQLGYSNISTLSSFADDSLTGIAAVVKRPNKLDTEEMYFNAHYLLTPYWRLGAGVIRREQQNDLVERRVNDLETVTTELTAAYISRARNQIGLSLRHEDGRYPTPITFAVPAPVFNDYQQKSIGAFMDWTLTGRSRLTGRLDYVDRSYEQLPQRDFDGFTGRLDYEWKPTGRWIVVSTVQREISGTEEVNTSFVRVTGAGIRPTLTLTGRTTLSGVLEYSLRDYLGDPRFLTTTLPQREDKLFVAAGTLTWRVDRVLTLLFGLQYERRTSNVPLNDYDVTLATMSARFRF